MNTFDIRNIPESYSGLGFTDVKLRDRFLFFVGRCGKPAEENLYYLSDVVRWIEWEKVPKLKDICNLLQSEIGTCK